MTSPLPPPIGSSPFTFPLHSFSPFPQSSLPTNTAPTQNPSPLPFHFTANPTPSNLPFSWPSSSPAFQTPAMGLQMPALQMPSLNFAVADQSEFGTLRGTLDGFGEGLERCLGVLMEIRRMEEGLFAGDVSGRSEGMEVGMGGLSRLELLHLEYTQLLSSLIALGTTTHLSSLPSPLSQALEPRKSDELSKEGSSNGVPPSGPVTVDHLTTWAEERANLEFNRREAVRASAKTVLDVLTKR